MKIITLPLSNGVEMSFSEQELIAIVEKHLSNETTQQTTTAKVAQKPTEDEWFEVKPQAINQELFERERENPKQEETRQLILEAFAVMKSNPEKYGKDFCTKMPNKTWPLCKTVAELKEMTCDRNADWVEQAFEWAQRIANGETWEAVCNDPDTARFRRLVIWKDGVPRIVGGSRNYNNYAPASEVDYDDDYYINRCLFDTVPLIRIYKRENSPLFDLMVGQK